MIGLEDRPRPFWSIWNEIVAFNDRHFHNWRKIKKARLTNAMSGELGELLAIKVGSMCSLTKKLEGGGTHHDMTENEIRDKLGEEAFDLLVYLILLLETLGVNYASFSRSAYRKLRELEERQATKETK